jgi:CTP:phosphocholine cytidylyltransferase-like protein/thiamine kinase-like enzyme
MSDIVIIPTAGVGARMGDLTANLNKCLLPYNGKPIITHIIDKFPKDSEFIILTGYQAQQVADYLELAHPDIHVKFVHVSMYVGPYSGTGTSLKKAKEHVDRPFWYVPCDTYFDEQLTNPTIDTYYVKSVPLETQHRYTMFGLSENHITDIKFKETCTNEHVAFTGLMYIQDYTKFFTDLDNWFGNEFIDIIPTQSNTEYLNTWVDFGNLDDYTNMVNQSRLYNFTKENEITYTNCNGKVLKWYKDGSIPEKKYTKTLPNPKVFPQNIKHQGHWLCYDYVEGDVLYNRMTPGLLEKLLYWLLHEVWVDRSTVLSFDKYFSGIRKFYMDKSYDRISMFRNKYPVLPKVTHVNGIKVQELEDYVKKIDWKKLIYAAVPVQIHGDLQFDNVIVDEYDRFTIIDWRHEIMNGDVTVGDVYYDVAKLVGGIMLDYSKIKQNEFTYKREGSEVFINAPCVENSGEYLSVVRQFADQNDLDWNVINTLVPLIYANMAPLHEPDFDLLLWYLSIELFDALSKVDHETLH